jgi:hypothetical protein
MVSVKYECPYLDAVCGYTRAKLRCNKCGAYSEIPAPPHIEEKTTFPNS